MLFSRSLIMSQVIKFDQLKAYKKFHEGNEVIGELIPHLNL